MKKFAALAAFGGLTFGSVLGPSPAPSAPHPGVHLAVAPPSPLADRLPIRASRSWDRDVLSPRKLQGARVLADARKAAALRARKAAAARAEAAARLKRARSTSVCNASNWRRTMTWQEVWIDTRESGMDPTPNDTNPSSGATTLGQLLPSTFQDLGLPISYDPCQELVAQRKYIAERYGSEDAAVAWWRSHNWY